MSNDCKHCAIEVIMLLFILYSLTHCLIFMLFYLAHFILFSFSTATLDMNISFIKCLFCYYFVCGIQLWEGLRRIFNSIQVYLCGAFHDTNFSKAALQKSFYLIFNISLSVSSLCPYGRNLQQKSCTVNTINSYWLYAAIKLTAKCGSFVCYFRVGIIRGALWGQHHLFSAVRSSQIFVRVGSRLKLI